MSPVLPVTSWLSAGANSAPGRKALAWRCYQQVRSLIAGGHLWEAQDLGRRRAKFLSDRGHSEEAISLLDSCRRAFERGEAQEYAANYAALMRLEILDLAFTAGSQQGWGEEEQAALDATLSLAESFWESGADERAAVLCEAAARVAFHPALQFGEHPSPLAAGPEPAARFLAGLHRTRAWQALGTGAPRRLTSQVGAADPGMKAAPGKEPQRILFVSLNNWNFVRGIMEDLSADPRFEVRRLDLGERADLPADLRPNRPALIALSQATARGASLPELPQDLAETLAWAEVIWVEWGAAAAAWITTLAPQYISARIVVRLHSFEASTVWPHLTHWAAVSDLVTVAPPIRAMLTAAVPAIEKAGVRIHTLPNRSELSRYRLPKEPGAEHTLALVGWASPRKDPAWALDVLAELRREDPRWRLLLIGPDFPAELPTAQRGYAASVTSRIHALGEVVTITGATSEVPRYLQQAGVILSTSRREGTHEGFIEGVASGALPVCRKWPDLAGWGGPETLFPREWIVTTPAEAAQRIRTCLPAQAAASHIPEGAASGMNPARALGEEAGELIRSQRDWKHVRAHYEALITAPACAQEGPVS